MEIIDSTLLKAFLNTCHGTSDVAGLKDDIYPYLEKIFPHKMFSCGAVKVADHRVSNFINLSFPSGYVENTKVVVCPALTRWLETGKPVHLDSSSSFFAAADDAWRYNFKKYKIKNLSVYGVLDLNKKNAHYFAFGDIDKWTEREESLLKFLVPQLYCALTKMNSQKARVSSKVLTRREREVLRWISKGKSNAEVANLLYISPWTVKIHVSNLMTKLEASNRSHAITRALELDLLEA